MGEDDKRSGVSSGQKVRHVQQICRKTRPSHLHENIHGHVHELGESAIAALGLPDRRLCGWLNVTRGVVELGAFALRCARGWVGVFLAIGRGNSTTSTGFCGHDDKWIQSVGK